MKKFLFITGLGFILCCAYFVFLFSLPKMVIFHDFYRIRNNPVLISKYSENNDTERFLKKYGHDRITRASDNQAPYPSLYYVGLYHHKTIELNGKSNFTGWHLLFPKVQLENVKID